MKNILIVEDEAIIAVLIEKQLQRFGYHVVAKVATEEAAMSVLENHPCDLVLMDIMLANNGDGVEVAKKMREISNVPVLYLTGNSDHQTFNRANTTNPAGFMVKPVDSESLRNAIESVLSESSETYARKSEVN